MNKEIAGESVEKKTGEVFHYRFHLLNLFIPIDGHIEPSCWAYIATVLNIYSHHTEYIDAIR